GSVKAECLNCGVTHTPLWRCGLNNELNCDVCGLYCKLVGFPLFSVWSVISSKCPSPSPVPMMQ
ncbi:hypothetical protein F5141DRAFT_1010598, partial [Pisolithus sp. B1]